MAFPGVDENKYQTYTDHLVDLDIRQQVLPSDEKARKAEQGAVQIMTTLLKRVAAIDDRFVTKLIKSGSYYDDVKVGQPDEFDFMAEIMDLSQLGVCNFKPTKDAGFVHILLQDEQMRRTWEDCMVKLCQHNIRDCQSQTCLKNKLPPGNHTNEVIAPDKIHAGFLELVEKVMSDRKFPLPSNWEHGGFDRPTFSGIRKHGPAILLQFAIRDYDEDKELILTLDVSVCIRVPQPVNLDDFQFLPLRLLTPVHPTHKLIKEALLSDGKAGLHVIPLYSKLLIRTERYDNKNAWRISTSMLEKYLLDQWPHSSVPKQCLRLLKYYRDKYLTEAKRPTKRKNARGRGRGDTVSSDRGRPSRGRGGLGGRNVNLRDGNHAISTTPGLMDLDRGDESDEEFQFLLAAQENHFKKYKRRGRGHRGGQCRRPKHVKSPQMNSFDNKDVVLQLEHCVQDIHIDDDLDLVKLGLPLDKNPPASEPFQLHLDGEGVTTSALPPTEVCLTTPNVTNNEPIVRNLEQDDLLESTVADGDVDQPTEFEYMTSVEYEDMEQCEEDIETTRLHIYPKTPYHPPLSESIGSDNDDGSSSSEGDQQCAKTTNRLLSKLDSDHFMDTTDDIMDSTVEPSCSEPIHDNNTVPGTTVNTEAVIHTDGFLNSAEPQNDQTTGLPISNFNVPDVYVGKCFQTRITGESLSCPPWESPILRTLRGNTFNEPQSSLDPLATTETDETPVTEIDEACSADEAKKKRISVKYFYTTVEVDKLTCTPGSGEYYGPRSYLGSIELKTFMLLILQVYPKEEFCWKTSDIPQIIIHAFKFFLGMFQTNDRCLKNYFFDTLVTSPTNLEKRQKARDVLAKLLKDIQDKAGVQD